VQQVYKMGRQLEIKRTSSNPNSKADVKKKRSSMEGGRSYTVRRRQVKVIRKNRRKNNKRKTEEASFNLEGTETSRDNDKKNADKYSENEKSQEVIILIFLSYDLTVGYIPFSASCSLYINSSILVFA